MARFWTWFTSSGPTGPAILAGSITLLVFLLTRLNEIYVASQARKTTKRRMAIGLYEEVRRNVESIEALLKARPDPVEIMKKVSEVEGFRPLLIISQGMDFYSSVTASIPDIETAPLIAVVDFYDQPYSVHRIAAAFEGRAFATPQSGGPGRYRQRSLGSASRSP